MLRNLTFVAIIVTSSVAVAGDSEIDEASKDLFVGKCSSCHSVGEGDRVGPDLKGVVGRRDEGWLTRIIQSPSSMLDSDSDARQLLAKFNNIRMPDLGLNEAQVKGIIALLDYCSENACKLAPELKPVTEAVAADFELGRSLFVGETAFKEGGPACISCHNVVGLGSTITGGTLAVDLTHSFAKLSDAGMDAALRNPAFPLMNKVFGDHPLTAHEVFSLRVLLYEKNRSFGDDAESHDKPLSVPLSAFILAIFVLMLMNAAWARRLKGIRKPMVGGRE